MPASVRVVVPEMFLLDQRMKAYSDVGTLMVTVHTAGGGLGHAVDR
jgi:hypothetical protein